MNEKVSEIEFTPYPPYEAPNVLERFKNNVFVPIGRSNENYITLFEKYKLELYEKRIVSSSVVGDLANELNWFWIFRRLFTKQ